MIVTIEISNVKPLLLNHATKITTRGKFASKYKTIETQNFTRQMNAYLRTMANKLSPLSKAYNEKEHYFIVDFKFYLPILTKKNLISKKSGDWDGFIKYTQDTIFDFIGIDDSQIIGGSSIKIHSDKYKIEVKIELRDLKEILDSSRMIP